MIENYLKTALRNMLRHKVHTLVNILGLTIGIWTSILVLRYVQNELSFDGWHSKLDRIYRVVVEINTGGQTRYHRHSSGPLAAALRHDLPEVEASARVWGRQWADVEANGKKLRMGVCAADPEMFSILDFPFVVGSLETAFADPLSIAMTEKPAARRLFGEADPIGKTVAVTSTNHGGERTVAALLKDLPANSTLQFDYVSTSVTAPVTWEQWTGSDGHRSVMTHVLLREDADPKALEAKLQSVIDRYYAPEVAEITSYKLQPLSRVYLHMRHDYGIDRWGDIDQVYQFSAIALLVMAIACINFTDLSIARSAGRAQEVGLRKVTGAHRGQLASQFLCESVLATLFSLDLALVAIEFALPEFNAIFNRQLELNFLSDGFLSIGVLSITLCVGLIAGIYPALVLTSFQPKRLKGLSVGAHTVNGSAKDWSLRNSRSLSD